MGNAGSGDVLKGVRSAVFHRVGKILGEHSNDQLIVSARRSHLGLLGWCQIRE